MSPLSSITQRLFRFMKAPMSLQNIMTTTMHEDTWGPFYKYGLTLIPTWISNYIHHNMRDEITYPFLNFNEGGYRLILLSIMSKKKRGIKSIILFSQLPESNDLHFPLSFIILLSHQVAMKYSIHDVVEWKGVSEQLEPFLSWVSLSVFTQDSVITWTVKHRLSKNL